MQLKKNNDFNKFQKEIKTWYKETEKEKNSIYKYLGIMIFLFMLFGGIGYLLEFYEAENKESVILDSNEEVFDITKYGDYREEFIEDYVNNKDSYIIEEIEYKYLQESDLEKYTKEELALIRNEIFARYGYIYEKEPYATYFKNKSWYSGYRYEVTFEELTKEAQANISLIRTLENK